MLKLILFLAINFIIFVFLKKINFKQALKAQALLFVCMLICLLVTCDVSQISSIIQSVLGDHYIVLRKALIGFLGASYTPMAMLQIIIAVVSVCAFLILSHKVVKVFCKRERRIVVYANKRELSHFHFIKNDKCDKKYILYCSYLC